MENCSELTKKKANLEEHHLLIIDDELRIQDNLKQYLKLHGYQTTVVDRGEKALEMLKVQPFDVVITDLYLSGIGGIEILKEIKSKASDIMVIILTSIEDIDDCIEAMQHGADDFLLKTCEFEEVRIRIEHVLEKRRLKKRVLAYESIIPICCVCKSIRYDEEGGPGKGKWIRIEQYLWKQSRIHSSHTYCPECAKALRKSIM